MGNDVVFEGRYITRLIQHVPQCSANRHGRTPKKSDRLPGVQVNHKNIPGWIAIAH